MFVGHYGVSFAAKQAEKRIPLWLLFLATQFIDVLWAIFVLLGIEKVRIVPGITAASPLDLYYMPYTHSLVGAAAWSVLAYLLCQAFPATRGSKPGLLMAIGVFSHWLLDLVVHRPDLSLYDGVFKMGLGLWNYPVPEYLLEIALLVGGAFLYLRNVARKARLVGFVCLLVVVQFIGTFAFPPPSSDRASAITALFFYVLFALFAWWADPAAVLTAKDRTTP
ncbi:MAG TPA: hypothetical protein VKZ53_14255 [Candidatus Angelobacter sp.]|nr:hypothetical protein [Candidatus Angelobacter sp.]